MPKYIHWMLTENIDCQLALLKNSLRVGLQNSSSAKPQFHQCPLVIFPPLHLSTSHFHFHSAPSLSLSALPDFPTMLSLPVCLNLPFLLFALPPCPSHSCQRTFWETSKLVCFLAVVLICQKPQPLSPNEMFYSWPFKGKLLLEIQDRVGCQLFSRTFAATENVIYQTGCAPLLGSVTVLTVLWWLSCLSLVVEKWEELDCHKSELSVTQLHISPWNRFRAVQ